MTSDRSPIIGNPEEYEHQMERAALTDYQRGYLDGRDYGFDTAQSFHQPVERDISSVTGSEAGGKVFGALAAWKTAIQREAVDAFIRHHRHDFVGGDDTNCYDVCGLPEDDPMHQKEVEQRAQTS